MDFIHKSSLKSHGNLKPTTCLVDSRLQVKLSGFGLWEFRHGTKHRVIPQENSKYTGRASSLNKLSLANHWNSHLVFSCTLWCCYRILSLGFCVWLQRCTG